MMKWIHRIVVSLIALVGVLALIGYLLPVGHVASRSAEFPRPPAEVYALVSDLENYSKWWPEGSMKVAVVERVPPSRFVTRIDEPDEPFGGTWTMEIVPTPAGSRLTITERGEIYNPIFRTMARFVFGYTSTMESCLAAAAKQLG